MSKRRRLSGRERREQRRRARQGPQLPKVPRGQFLLIGAGAMTAGLVALALVLAVFGGSEGGSPSSSATPTPAESSGPPPVDGEPAYSESGLGIIDIEPGTGEAPQEGQLLVVNYTGWLSDGTMFDTSLDDEQPFQFALGAGFVIPGWDEGMATMQVGGKRRLIIPPELAYGEEGRPGIPPNSVLTFDVELLEIK